MGVYDNTLIVVTSDHGEAFGERNLLGHGHGVYQDEIAVPLIIKYPGGRHAAPDSVVVGGVDLLPTTLRAVGLPIPAGIDGRSVADEADAASAVLIGESFGAPGVAPGTSAVQRFVLSWPFKLIASGQRAELYNLADDPDETRDIRSTRSDVATRLETAMAAYAAQPGRSARPVPESTRGLGYLR